MLEAHRFALLVEKIAFADTHERPRVVRRDALTLHVHHTEVLHLCNLRESTDEVLVPVLVGWGNGELDCAVWLVDASGNLDIYRNRTVNVLFRLKLWKLLSNHLTPRVNG